MASRPVCANTERAVHNRRSGEPRLTALASLGMYNWAYLWPHAYRPRSTPEGEAFLSCMEPWAEHGVVVACPEGSLPSGSGSERDLQTDVAFLEAAVE